MNELNKDQLMFIILENMVVLFERELPKKILKSNEFQQIKKTLETLYQKVQ